MKQDCSGSDHVNPLQTWTLQTILHGSEMGNDGKLNKENGLTVQAFITATGRV